jgi:dimethylargininase
LIVNPVIFENSPMVNMSGLGLVGIVGLSGLPQGESQATTHIIFLFFRCWVRIRTPFYIHTFREESPSFSGRRPTMPVAITREVSSSLERCELTHLLREPIDVARAKEQHRRYEQCLRDLGCEVVSLPAAEDLPDAVFVEDTAIVLDELAILTRPGAASRVPETASIGAVLRRYREVQEIQSPGMLDGGDVLRIGKTLYVGASQRSNSEAVEQLIRILKPQGYRVNYVPIRNCLHLKTAVTQVGENLLLGNREWVDVRFFNGMQWIDVDPTEPAAANALRIGQAVIYPAGFPRTQKRLEEQGIAVCPVEISELQKAEAGVTCCSLLIEGDAVMDIRITDFTAADCDEVLALWQGQPGVGLGESDTVEAITAYLRRNPGMSFLAREGNRVVGAVLCGHDGRRGYLHHLFVASTHRRQGIGRRLVQRCLDRLSEERIPKCNIFLFGDNTEGAEFWQAIGFRGRFDLKILQWAEKIEKTC